MKGLGTTVLIVVRALPADQPHTGLVFTHTHDILLPFSILQSLSLLSCALCLALSRARLLQGHVLTRFARSIMISQIVLLTAKTVEFMRWRSRIDQVISLLVHAFNSHLSLHDWVHSRPPVPIQSSRSPSNHPASLYSPPIPTTRSVDPRPHSSAALPR
jgi:hypothetical protein